MKKELCSSLMLDKSIECYSVSCNVSNTASNSQDAAEQDIAFVAIRRGLPHELEANPYEWQQMFGVKYSFEVKNEAF